MVATVATTTDTIVRQIAEHEDELSRVRGQLDQVRAEEDDLLIAQGVGQKIDVRRLDRLGHDAAALERKEAQTARVIAGLKERARAEQADERRRRVDAAQLRRREISARARGHEDEYLALCAQVVAKAQEILDERREFADLSYPELAGDGCRAPYLPPLVPERVILSRDGYWTAEQWMAEWRETHP